ncbi:MAG TPA: response regulator transcription factor [Candidatus Cottocaccamicrobium excrementipullorum]|mgnify:CR=1 FL=1|nr:response regulator transcription factor [Candidatus Cottocaccamicrobium excrementipullorum]
MRVAVCDKDPQVLEQVAGWVRDMEFVSRCDTFSLLSKIVRAVELGGDYDIILMAISWGEEHDGIDAARRIGQLDARAKIIYMSQYTEKYVQEIFLSPVNLSGFLVKPVDRVILERNLQKAMLTSQKPRDRRLEIKYKNAVISVLYEDIIYLESMGHTIVIHTEGRDYQSYDRLERVLAALPEHFLHCHKSYVVNMNYIRTMDKKKLILVNGKEIPISRARVNESRQRYKLYTEELLLSLKNRKVKENNGGAGTK